MLCTILTVAGCVLVACWILKWQFPEGKNQ